MNKFFKPSAIILAATCLCSCGGEDDAGGMIVSGKVSVKENLQAFSPENNMSFSYNVILPSSFNVDPSRTYPVLYLLHGAGGSNADWCSQGNARAAVQAAIDGGVIPEIVVIMPDAKNTAYVDGFQDGIKYETFFHDTFMPYVEKLYRIDGSRDHRFIAGLSMGGFGCSYYAFKYSGKFRYCYCMSGAVEGMGSELTPDVASMLEGKDFSEMPAYTMDIGTEDFLYDANVRTHNVLTGMGFAHEYIERPGAHDWTFWTDALPKALERIGTYLK